MCSNCAIPGHYCNSHSLWCTVSFRLTSARSAPSPTFHGRLLTVEAHFHGGRGLGGGPCHSGGLNDPPGTFHHRPLQRPFFVRPILRPCRLASVIPRPIPAGRGALSWKVGAGRVVLPISGAERSPAGCSTVRCNVPVPFFGTERHTPPPFPNKARIPPPPASIALVRTPGVPQLENG